MLRILSLLVVLMVTVEQVKAWQEMMFSSQSPWFTQVYYESEGTCEYNLDAVIPVGALKINITMDGPIISIRPYELAVVRNIGFNMYMLENKYADGPGRRTYKFHFLHSSEEPLSGYCERNVQSTDTPPTYTTTPLTYTTIPPTYTTIPPTYSAIPPTYTTIPPTYTTIPPKHSTIPPMYTDISPQYSSAPPTINISNSCQCSTRGTTNPTPPEVLASELKIDTKSTLLARSKKISMSDNRPSARAVGCLSVLLVCMFFGIIAVSDLELIVNAAMRFNFLKKERTCEVEDIPAEDEIQMIYM